MAIHKIYKSDAEVTPLATQLWAVNNCFDSETFEWLSQLYLNHDERWHRHTDCLKNRLQLAPESKSYELIQELCCAITPEIEHIVNCKLVYAGCKVWLDLPGFQCPPHADPGILVTTYQVYLWSSDDHGTGTTFTHGPNPVTVPFGPNMGYINLNTDSKNHHVKSIDSGRLSIAFQWAPVPEM
jgi:hypothetical protein